MEATAQETAAATLAAERFLPQAASFEVEPFGQGNVNATYLVTPGTSERFILQRINTHVFRAPTLVMGNIRTVTEHIRQSPLPCPGRRFEVPTVRLTRDGSDHWTDANGGFWRALRFIENARSFDTIQGIDHAREVGYALGLFQSLISDLPADRLADTLEGFHITPAYLARFDAVCRHRPLPTSAEVAHALEFVNQRRAWAGVLELAKARGELPLRPIHGDPKVNNVLLDTQSGRAVSLIDLDTVKPGLIHYDVGDCLRSCCNPLGEETERWEAVRFEPDLCRAILEGYLSLARRFLTPQDFDYLTASVRLIAFELGLRFLTDYLEGNVYFRARTPEHNLTRALVQFKLCESIERQAPAIDAIIRELL